MSTPHNMAEKGALASTVIMPGDPLRAKYIAENYLTDVTCFNTVRNMLGYTGKYKGKKVSTMGSGMGMPSIGIYSFELFNFYGVDRIIRTGTAGGISDKVKLGDIIVAMGASTDSNYVNGFGIPGTFATIADYETMQSLAKEALKSGANVQVGNVLSSDNFYVNEQATMDKWKNMGVLAVEMESAALYINAAYFRKKAATILTVSDHLYNDVDLKMSTEDRQNHLDIMIKASLETAIRGENNES